MPIDNGLLNFRLTVLLANSFALRTSGTRRSQHQKPPCEIKMRLCKIAYSIFG